MKLLTIGNILGRTNGFMEMTRERKEGLRRKHNKKVKMSVGRSFRRI